MPWIDDIISSGNSTHEVFSSDENLSLMTHEQAAKMFGVDLDKSPNLTYLPFTLCSSFPNFNKKGRGFSPAVLAASFASLNGQVVDMEHMMNDNSSAIKEDWILGYVKGMKFPTPKKMPELVTEKGTHELAKFKSPLPVTGLSALFNRAIGVSSIVDDYIGGKNLWKVSMECNHSWGDAVFYYDGVFIPVKEAAKAMRDCITANGIKDYKGKPLKALLGELAGEIDFWGVALTQMPADTTADVFSLVAAPSRDAASFIPMKKINFREAASTRNIFSGEHVISEEDIEKVSDRLINESSSITVIGNTEPAIDGHTHEILSDLTVVPTLGHSHYLNSKNLSTGKKAAFTAATDTYMKYSDYPTTRPETHLHLVNIPLQGEVIPDSGSSITEEEMPKSIAEMRKQIADLVKLVSKDKADTELASISSGLNELLTEMSSIQSEESMKKFFDDTLAAKIASGEIQTKEAASTALLEAVKKREDELKAEFAAEKLKSEQAAARDRLILTSGLDLASVLPNVKAGDKPVTIKDRFDAIPLENTAGLEQEIATMKLIFPDKGGKKKDDPVPPKHTPAGGPHGTETASTTTTEEKPAPAHLRGRSAMSGAK